MLQWPLILHLYCIFAQSPHHSFIFRTFQPTHRTLLEGVRARAGGPFCGKEGRGKPHTYNTSIPHSQHRGRVQVRLVRPDGHGDCRGGCLADEMGLGKTVFFSSLLLHFFVISLDPRSFLVVAVHHEHWRSCVWSSSIPAKLC